MIEGPKISIITACFNSDATLEKTLKSLYSQTYKNFQHVIVDACSTDNSLKIISRNNWKDRIVLSEKDKGINDAFNKGLNLCTGSVVGFLNSDDQLTDGTVLQKIAIAFHTEKCDVSYGDLKYFSLKNPKKVVRNWIAGQYKQSNLVLGWMPPHPTFYCKMEIIKAIGAFKIDLDVSADYDLMLRILQKKKYKIHYIPSTLVNMQLGGKSNTNIFKKLREDYSIISNSNLLGILTLIAKNFRKLGQFFV